MKRKTNYEWWCESRDDGYGYVDSNESTYDSLKHCVGGELEDYGYRDDPEPYWEICLNKRVWDVEEEDILEEDWFYLELVDGQFQFSPKCGEPPKRFKAQLEKLNKELS
tara:strand:+ start:336 stop:662 length:327 start_codon:yes stop_codon:yes gene_type:complete